MVNITFENCTDILENLASLELINDDCIYLFTNKCGKLAEKSEEEILNAFNCNSDAAVVYADEGYPNGEFWYKPDFSPDTLNSFFYIGNIFAIKGKFIRAAWSGKISLYEAVVKVTELVDNPRKNIIHLNGILFENSNEAEVNKLYGLNMLSMSESKLVEIDDKLVSIVIPSKDNSEILTKCIESIKKYTTDVKYEILVVDNGSDDGEKKCISHMSLEYGFKYIYEKQDFNFSKMCNMGAEAAKGDYLLFLNDDIEIINEKWLYNMLLSAVKNHVGAVGAKLYYPDYRIQHVGITNMGIGPAHKLCGSVDINNYQVNLYHGHNIANYNMIAVTGACLMVRHELFENIGGFDEGFPVAYNDVELCFRLYKAGLYNVVRNDAVLIHHESLSRGEDTSQEKKKRLINEKHKLYKKHPDMRAYDPFYSPNLVQWKWDSEYSGNLIFEYDRLVNPIKPETNEIKGFPKEHKNKYIKKLTGENLLMLNIDGTDYVDSVENMYDKNLVLIRGWAAIRERDNSDVSCKKWLLLKSASDEDNIYKLEIHPKPREDVAVLFDDKTKNAINSGINVLFEEKAIPNGKYIIGVLFDTKRHYIKWSTETIDINY